MKRFAGLAAVLALACGGPPESLQEPAPAPQMTPAPAVPSAISFLRGAVVVDRTGEGALATSPLQALDDDDATLWSSPEGDPRQSVEIALPVRTRIDSLSLSHGRLSTPGVGASKVLFEHSSDGTAWAPLGTITVSKPSQNVVARVPPAETQYVRATMAAALNGGEMTVLPTLAASGAELSPFVPARLEGSWMIDTIPARFEQRARRVTGVVTLTTGEPMRLDGGWDGRHVRFLWTRGMEYGLAMVAVAPDGAHFSGFAWYEEVLSLFLRATWFGAREDVSRFFPTPAPPPVTQTTALIPGSPIPPEGRRLPSKTSPPPRDEPVVDAFLRRFNAAPLYQITFVGDSDQVDPVGSAEGFAILRRLMAANRAAKAILTVYEFREATPAANQERSVRRAQALREALAAAGFAMADLEIRAAGAVDPTTETDLPIQKLMHSRVELSLNLPR
ncbi:MAG: discoidin domain-containing protein [Thermoanaerobaculia bacterium]